MMNKFFAALVLASVAIPALGANPETGSLNVEVEKANAKINDVKTNTRIETDKANAKINNSKTDTQVVNKDVQQINKDLLQIKK